MKKAGLKFCTPIVVGIILIAFLLLLFIFSTTRGAFEAWEHLQQLPPVLYYSYLVVIGISIPFSLWAAYKLLEPTFILEKSKYKDESTKSMLKALNKAEKTGIDTTVMRHEIEELQARKNAGTVHVALFGDVSTGKSSIIKALLPDVQIEINIRAGTTLEIKEYIWKSTSGDQLILTDLPGLHEADGKLDLLSQEEAIRAQIVIYVTDSDLSRIQYNDIQQLKDFDKPLLVALNKIDRFSDEDKELFYKRFKKHFPDQSTKLVFVQSGGEEEILKIYPDEREEKFIRKRKADVSSLTQALQDEIHSKSNILESLRDASVFKLVKQKLEYAKIDSREERAEEIIKNSTLKAVVGALAALSPGSDLIIQGVLGTLMVKQLCAVYEVPVSQLDIDKLLKYSGSKIKKGIPLILVLAGNGMKAFPGIGTLTGGLTHAVAYGLIFNTLGHTIHKTLKQHGR